MVRVAIRDDVNALGRFVESLAVNARGKLSRAEWRRVFRLPLILSSRRGSIWLDANLLLLQVNVGAVGSDQFALGYLSLAGGALHFFGNDVANKQPDPKR